jgi:hypothetical protein
MPLSIKQGWVYNFFILERLNYFITNETVVPSEYCSLVCFDFLKITDLKKLILQKLFMDYKVIPRYTYNI